MNREEFIKVMEFNEYEDFEDHIEGSTLIVWQSKDHRVLLFFDPDTCEVDAHVYDRDGSSLGWFCTQSWNKLNAFLDVCDCQQLVI